LRIIFSAGKANLPEKTFDENYKVFSKVINSFHKIEYIPKNKIKEVSENSIKNLLNIDWLGEALGWWAAGSIW
jgi:hypothetical protein